jgi:CheY-like chemotaxis protein
MNIATDTKGSRRVLLVDDERLVREMVRVLLCQEGYAVVEANNGAEALGLFTRGKYDLVMTDYEMPFIKGNELALKIKKLAPRQPILMMTGYRHDASPDNPVDGILDKPFNFSRLREAMAQVFAEVEANAAAGADDPADAN